MNLTPVMVDAPTHRENIRRKTVEAFQQAFPLQTKNFLVELANPRIEHKDFSSNEQKQAILEGRSLTERVRGDLSVKNSQGEVVSHAKDFTLMHLPWFTPRHTFVVDGNEYSVSNQIRTKPGIYTRRRGNEDLEAAFNLSKGANFRLSMDPEDARLHMEYGTTKIPLYPVLRALGVPHQDIATHWGSEVAAMNRDAYKTPDRHVVKLYERLIPESKQIHVTLEGKIQAIHDYYGATKMDPEVNKSTLGEGYDHVSQTALLAASKKLLDVHRAGVDTDDRDSLEYKTFHSVDDFIKERIGLDARAMKFKVGLKLDAHKGELRKAMPSGPFTRSVNSFLTNSSLSAVPTQINPMELIDQAVRITSLGEGGIANDRAIPMEARNLHASHLAVIDPSRTPECHSSDTEVFTSKGWKRWPDVTEADWLACRVDERLEFHRPKNLTAQPYSGPMYGVKTGPKGTISYLVTPNHRVLCKPCELRGTQTWRINRADEVHGKARSFDTAHEPFVGKTQETFDLPRVAGRNKDEFPAHGGRLKDSTINVDPIPMTDWASFMGWYLAEGCTVYDEHVKYAQNGTYQVLISQDEKANPEKCQIIEALLNRMPFTWSKRGGDTYVIGVKQLAAYLKDFGFCYDKYIPEHFFTASVEARENLLEALLLGDGRIGCRRATGKSYDQEVFCTTSPRLAVDFERLAISLGRPVRVARYQDNREERYLDVYEIRLLRARIRGVFPKKGHYFIEQYDGTVYCAEVPGNLLYTRRGDCVPLWTGNSFKAGIDIRAAIGARHDDAGNLYTRLVDTKTNKVVYLKPTEVVKAVVAFPGEAVKPGKMVDAMAGGEVRRVAASEVTHQIEHQADMYGPTTNLLPFINGMQGNRVTMASKHQSQALSLIHREAPLVQVQSWEPHVSMEEQIARLVVPTAPVAGRVTKVDGDYIYVQPHTAKQGFVVGPSPVHGEGIIADHHVQQGAALGPALHRIATTGNADKDFERTELGRYVNHSETPNATLSPTEHGYDLIALRALRPDEEVLVNYKEAPFATQKISSDDDLYCDFLKLGSDDGVLKLHYDTNFPLAAKTYLHNTVNVKEGDEVHAGQQLAHSNFTKDGVMALGTNLRVAYMPYHGLNTNDGIVISQGAADKLVSEHMYKHGLSLDSGMHLGRDRHRSYYGNAYTAAQYDKLDEHGVVKPGTIVHPGDPLIAALQENKATGNAVLLGKLSKSLVKPYRDEAQTWDHDMPGEVIDAVRTGDHVTVTVKTQEPMHIGDKLSNRFGAKGVVAKIIPDHQMIHDEQKRPVDLLFTSAGIVSRVNPAQIIEAALGKVADHTGKSISVEQFAQHDNVEYARELLKKHGLKDKETVTDPITGKEIKGVFVGKSYILKLFKTTDTNWSAHGAEKYDFNQQPARGGDDGAKALGRMEVDGLIAHNARNILREAATIKSQKNDEFWRAIQLGLPTPSPKTTFAYDKFLGMLQGAGVKVSKAGSRLTLGPLTDNDITKMSAGALKDPHKLLRAKDLAPENGGLFDPVTTGGTSGTKWSHVQLHEAIVNPVFEEPVRRLLGLTQKEFRDLHGQHGGAYFQRELSKINVSDKYADLKAQTKTLKGAQLDGAVKQLKYLSALKAMDLTPAQAYVLTKVPVTPPVLRPVLPLKSGQLQVGDANLLYRDAFLANQKLSEVKGVLPANMLKDPRLHLYDAVSAVFGVGDPVSPTAEKRGAKGYLAMITGTRPGNGFFQGKLIKRQQDVSGRGTIAPDPTLSMDEVGIPQDMLYGMYGKFIIGRLVKKGYSALDAQKMVEDKNPLAHRELLSEAQERPVLINRAPSLHRFSIVGAYPKITSGKTIMLNPMMEKGMGADYDGDAVQVHAPVTPAGIADAKKMTLSKLVFSDRKPGLLNVALDMEAIMGLHRASQTGPGELHKFENREAALAAYHAGDVQLNDSVEISE